jgi:hypothetical protein
MYMVCYLTSADNTDTGTSSIPDLDVDGSIRGRDTFGGNTSDLLDLTVDGELDGTGGESIVTDDFTTEVLVELARGTSGRAGFSDRLDRVRRGKREFRSSREGLEELSADADLGEGLLGRGHFIFRM